MAKSQASVTQDITTEDDQRAHTYAFNPYQLQQNCFYVALGRLMSIDSATVAIWAGANESETEIVGLSAARMSEVVETCITRTRMRLKFINLRDDQHSDGYDDINSGDELDIEALHRVAAKHGIVGPCFAVEIKVHGNMGHFVIVQRTRPEVWHVDGVTEWRDQDDANNHHGAWKLEDFQIHCNCEQTRMKLHSGTVRSIMGNTQAITTVFGSKRKWDLRSELPLIEAKRELRLRMSWKVESGQWSFAIAHHGHWGHGLCVGEAQMQNTEPQWRYRDFTPDDGRKWFIGEGFWQYSFDGSTWITAKFERCNKADGWGSPCIVLG